MVQSSAPALRKLTKKHPLQRFDSPATGISAIIHSIGIASFAGSFNYLQQNPNHINQSYGWHFQYLTIIGLALSTLTFVTALLADVTSSTALFKFKALLSTSSLPLAAVISSLYWGLRTIDPALVVPPDLEIPLYADLGFHAFPTILLLIDLLFLSPPWTIEFVPATILSTGIAFAYWFWIELCYSKNGFYPYPLFEILDTKQRATLFLGSALAMACMTRLLRLIYSLVNGVDAAMTQ